MILTLSRRGNGESGINNYLNIDITNDFIQTAKKPQLNAVAKRFDGLIVSIKINTPRTNDPKTIFEYLTIQSH